MQAYPLSFETGIPETGIHYLPTPALHVKPTRAVSDFPEQRFSPAPERRRAYRRRVHAGYAEMKKRRVVIAGLARNLDPVLGNTITRVERLGRYFEDYRVVIFENDSQDATAERLKDWAACNSRVSILSETFDDPVHPPTRCGHRATRMAYYRQQYRDLIANDYADYDEAIVVDMDLEWGWSYDGVANTYGHKEWDFVGSYGLIIRRLGTNPNHLVQYDAWAFRQANDYTPLPSKLVNFLKWDRGAPLVPIASCFGGLGVYRMAAFLSSQYEGGDCEHVKFHRHMRQRGFTQQYLNPSQITLYGRRHRSWDSTLKFISQSWSVLSANGTEWQ